MYMYVTKSISTGLYPNLDLWTANKLQLQLHNLQRLQFFIVEFPRVIAVGLMTVLHLPV